MEKSSTLETSVCIIGAGPAGIVLANILLDNGIDCIVVDHHSREEIYQRGRAGLLESTTVKQLDHYQLADTIYKNGRKHEISEFRSPDFSLEFNFSEFLKGETRYVYSQSELNNDLIEHFINKGGNILFNYSMDEIDSKTDAIIAHGQSKTTGQTLSIKAKLCAGCDGYHGVTRRSLPEHAVTNYEKQYPFRWLTIQANAVPSTNHALYGLHSEGFAAHLPRSKTESRYYLQVPPGDHVDNWSDERIWSTLDKRLEKKGWVLNKGKITSKTILEMRAYVMEPMQYKRLLFAGDAAHIITPLGGKGLNLAAQDAMSLAGHMIEYFQNQLSLEHFSQYSKQRLEMIWRAQEFSNSMLHMLHRAVVDDAQEVRFLNKINKSKIRQLSSSSTFATDFARNYVGIIKQAQVKQKGLSTTVDISKIEKKTATESLKKITSKYTDRNTAIRVAYASKEYSYQQIADFYSLHSNTIGRIVRKRNAKS